MFVFFLTHNLFLFCCPFSSHFFLYFFAARGGFNFGLQSVKVQIALGLFLAWSSFVLPWIFFGRFERLASLGLAFDRRLSLKLIKIKDSIFLLERKYLCWNCIKNLLTIYWFIDALFIVFSKALYKIWMRSN